MKACTVFPGTRSSREVKRLYQEAFLPEERCPFLRLLLLNIFLPAVSFKGYWREKEFCGFTLTVCSDKYLYINFIAVVPRLRSGGIGAEILGQLAREYPDKTMLVEVLAPREDAPDLEQRVKRIAFYCRNGFHDLQRTVSGKGGDYMLFSTDRAYDRDAYWSIFASMSFRSVFRFKRFREHNSKKR